MTSIYVVTVCRNALRDLTETVENVSSHKAEFVKHIIIDGDSTDGTKAYLAKKSDEIHFYVSEPDSGIYDAMNKGWDIVPENCYVLFLGAGDKIIRLPDYKSHADVIFGDVDLGNGHIFRSEVGVRTNQSNTIHHQAMLILKKAPFVKAPFDKNYRVYGDYDMNLKMLSAGFTFVRDDVFLSYAKPGGVSAVFNHRENIEIIFKNRGFFWTTVACARYCVSKLKKLIHVYRE